MGDELVFDQAKALLDQLPADVDWNAVNTKFARDSTNPYVVVLLQEIERYNILLQKVRSSLKELQKGIQGFVVISEEQELVFQALFEGKVPDGWLFAYPSMKPLGSWMPDLIKRVEGFRSWGLTEPPKCFWLAAFTYPSGFLTAILQFSARKNAIAVDQLSFDFVVQTSYTDDFINAAPKEGSYCKDLILEGGKWDMDAMSLGDQDPMMLYSPVPVILFKPIAKKKQTESTSNTIYQCPVYVYPNRNGSPTRPSFVVWVEVKSGAQEPGFWIKRGTAMLLATAA